MKCVCGNEVTKAKTFCGLQCQKNYFARGFATGKVKRLWREKHDGFGSYQDDDRCTASKRID